MQKRKSVLITTDSVCDLPRELIQKYQIVLNYYYVRTETGRFTDVLELDSKDLLCYMERGLKYSVSEAPTIDEYRDFFQIQTTKAEHIIHITMGKEASKGYEYALQASQKFSNVTVVDSGHLSSGMGIVVLNAAKLALEGESHRVILEKIARDKKNVQTSFIVRETEFMHRAGRISGSVKKLADRLLLHPVLHMKKNAIAAKSVYVGQWDKVIVRYIKSALSGNWNIDRSIVFITYANVDFHTLEYIKEEVLKCCPFEQVVFQQASAAISANCGSGSFGIIFARKDRKRKKAKESLPKKNRYIRYLIQSFYDVFLREDFEIHHRLMNLILSSALVGGTFAMMITLLLGALPSAIAIAGILLLVIFCLYISVIRENSKLAGSLICLLANTIAFPIMYLQSGGLNSGMIIWFVLGLLFTWLIVKGWQSYVIFALNLCSMIAVMIIGEKYPQCVQEVTEDYHLVDAIQSLIFVSCVFGIILKFQNYINEKQRKQLEEHSKELQAANQAKNFFLANMSHEIRTPINGIIGMDTMMLRECGDNENLKEYALNIQSASQSLMSIVNDILDISKIEAGKLTILPVKYSLFDVILDCYNIAAPRAAEKGLDFLLDIDPKIPARLEGDEIRVRQIINNLLSNAIKYTENGSVTLKITFEEMTELSLRMEISVEDTGIGIREQDREKLFEAFQRLDEKQNRRIEGTGLGLKLTMSLVKMMGGSIRLDSTYGKGSVFTADIYQNIASREAFGDFFEKQKEKLRMEQDTMTKLYVPNAKVLVVDDVAMNLSVAKGFLKYYGITAQTADSGMEALELVRQNPYDLIFMDHLMPVMDGVECLHRMKTLEDNPNKNTPVVILTANAVRGAEEEYARAGFSGYLSKPIHEGELRDILERLLPNQLKESNVQEENVQEEFLQEESGNDDMAEQGTQEAKWENPLEKQFPFLDVTMGLSYCMEDEDFYREMIGLYEEEDKTGELKEFYDKKDWSNYRIVVHALKNTTMTIGNETLSEDAKQLEFAARDLDVECIKANHPVFLENYETLLRNIRCALGKLDTTEEQSGIPQQESDIPQQESDTPQQVKGLEEGETGKSYRERVDISSANILVVDDDPFNIKMARKLLDENYQIFTAGDGEEALSILRQQKIDLVLLDIHMPGMDGHEVIRQIRSDRELDSLPVIFLTADDDNETEAKGFDEGASDFIRKPFDQTVATKRIERVLEHSYLQRFLQKEVARQTKKAEDRRIRVEKMSDQLVKTLGNSIDAKDRYTNGHSARVAKYSVMLAKELGYKDDQLKQIEYIGMLHDVGKIGIPDTIINKDSGLTDEEYEIMKKHPIIGYEILKEITQIPGIGIGARWHHERIDGKGYPDHLNEDEIPEIARIIGVADAYDAMTSKRSYRDILPQEVVRREIEKGRGTQFDSKIADVMLKLIDSDTQYEMHE